MICKADLESLKLLCGNKAFEIALDGMNEAELATDSKESIRRILKTVRDP